MEAKWKGDQGFPGVSDGKESACNAREPGSIPGSGGSPGEGNGRPLQYSCLKNSVDRGAWQSTVHYTTEGVTLSHFFSLPSTLLLAAPSPSTISRGLFFALKLPLGLVSEGQKQDWEETEVELFITSCQLPPTRAWVLTMALFLS